MDLYLEYFLGAVREMRGTLGCMIYAARNTQDNNDTCTDGDALAEHWENMLKQLPSIREIESLRDSLHRAREGDVSGATSAPAHQHLNGQQPFVPRHLDVTIQRFMKMDQLLDSAHSQPMANGRLQKYHCNSCCEGWSGPHCCCPECNRNEDLVHIRPCACELVDPETGSPVRSHPCAWDHENEAHWALVPESDNDSEPPPSRISGPEAYAAYGVVEPVSMPMDSVPGDHRLDDERSYLVRPLTPFSYMFEADGSFHRLGDELSRPVPVPPGSPVFEADGSFHRLGDALGYTMVPVTRDDDVVHESKVQHPPHQDVPDEPDIDEPDDLMSILGFGDVDPEMQDELASMEAHNI